MRVATMLGWPHQLIEIDIDDADMAVPHYRRSTLYSSGRVTDEIGMLILAVTSTLADVIAILLSRHDGTNGRRRHVAAWCFYATLVIEAPAMLMMPIIGYMRQGNRAPSPARHNMMPGDEYMRAAKVLDMIESAMMLAKEH